MITEKQYKEAVADQERAEKIINAYHAQKSNDFKQRWARLEAGEQYFTEDELIYAAHARCDHCDAGLAYPKDCGVHHEWSCSKVLTEKVDDRDMHPNYPFAFYEIKSENQPSAHGSTTRPKA